MEKTIKETIPFAFTFSNLPLKFMPDYSFSLLSVLLALIFVSILFTESNEKVAEFDNIYSQVDKRNSGEMVRGTGFEPVTPTVSR